MSYVPEISLEKKNPIWGVCIKIEKFKNQHTLKDPSPPLNKDRKKMKSQMTFFSHLIMGENLPVRRKCSLSQKTMYPRTRHSGRTKPRPLFGLLCGQDRRVAFPRSEAVVP